MNEKSNKDIKVVKAIPEDALGILNVFYETWLGTYPNDEYGITVDDVEDRFKDSFKKENIKKREEKIKEAGENEIKLNVKEEGKIIGLIHIDISPLNNRLVAIYVLPQYQRKGMGYLLWKEAKKYIDLNKKTLVQVASYNSKAIDFYKRLGFKKTDKIWFDEKYKMKSGNIIPLTELLMEPKLKK
jgi:ribosomal protein S18 acetylase RimI-like enzyme